MNRQLWQLYKIVFWLVNLGLFGISGLLLLDPAILINIIAALLEQEPAVIADWYLAHIRMTLQLVAIIHFTIFAGVVVSMLDVQSNKAFLYTHNEQDQ